MDLVISKMKFFVALVVTRKKPLTIVKKEVYLRLGRVLGSISVQLKFFIPSEALSVFCGNS